MTGAQISLSSCLFLINMNNNQENTNTEKEINSDVKSQPENIISKYIIHRPLTLKKKLYLSELLAEKTIQIVAFVSIAAIIAIFYYVFQESIYAFKSEEKKTELTSQTGAVESLQSESFQSETYSPESYTPGTESASNNQEELVPETYGTVPTDEQIQNDNAGSEKPIVESVTTEKPQKIKDLVLPNDKIDNKPAYVWQPISDNPKYSFVPLFIGALKVTLIGILIAAPIAILAAIFTVAFAPRWMKEIIKPAIEILAGFPSVVIGFFALITLASVIQDVFGNTYRLNSFVGGIGMALAVIPIIYTVTEDALSAVPKYMKEASLAIGASRWQTAWRVMLPAATPGVFAAIILGFGRAFGETMIALMATGNAALVSSDIFESVRTMAATIGAEMAEVEFHSVHYGVLFLIGAVLFVVTFSLNALAEFYVRNKLMKKFQGK